MDRNPIVKGRLSKGWRQVDLQSMLAFRGTLVCRTSISNWERGLSIPRTAHVRQLSAVLDIDILELVDGLERWKAGIEAGEEVRDMEEAQARSDEILDTTEDGGEVVE